MGCVQSAHRRSFSSDDDHHHKKLDTNDRASSEMDATPSAVALPYERREEVQTALVRDQYAVIASTESLTATASNESPHTQQLATRHFEHAQYASASFVSSTAAIAIDNSSKPNFNKPPPIQNVEHDEPMDPDDEDDGYASQSIVLISQQNSPTVKSTLQIRHAHTSNDSIPEVSAVSATRVNVSASSELQLAAPVLKPQRSAPLPYKTYKRRTPRPRGHGAPRHLQTRSDNINIQILSNELQSTVPNFARSKSSAVVDHHHVLSKYAYNTHKNGEINTTKNKHGFVHAKSRSIPQNLFSSTLNEYQTAENNTYQYLSQITHFDQNALRLLHLRFDHVDTLYTCNGMAKQHAVATQPQPPEADALAQAAVAAQHEIQSPRGKWSIEHMAFIFGLPPHCVLVKRFFAMMDQHGMKEISFRVFAITMSILTDKASVEEKCKFSFALYDLNNDDAIDADELRTLLDDLLTSAQTTFDPNLCALLKNERFMSTLVEQTMREFELDEHRRITYAAYCKYAQRNPRLLSPYTLDVEKLLDFEAEQRRMNRISMNSLAKKQLRQMVIGQDPKKVYNKKWHKPQWYKQIQRDEVQKVDSIHDASDICKDLDVFGEQQEQEQDVNSSLREMTEASRSSNEEDQQAQQMQQKIQDTIDFLYD